MNTEKLLAEVQECRDEMHRVVDARFDLIVECIRSGKPLPKPDTVLPLSTAPSRFKRSKPVAVIFPDGRRLEVTKWKAAVTAIFQECANTTPYGDRLMAIRGKVMGRQRTILGASPQGMNVPLEIMPGLYMEGKFDTESLIYALTKRVFEPIGYDYGEILIQLHQAGK